MIDLNARNGDYKCQIYGSVHFFFGRDLIQLDIWDFLEIALFDSSIKGVSKRLPAVWADLAA
jgi:hypothetical protein